MQTRKGKQEVDKAMGDIKGLDAVRRADAAVALGIFGDETALPTLRQALRDSSAQVKVSALYSLCLLGDRTAIPQLIGHLADDRPLFRKLALTALEQSTDVKHGGKHDDLESCKKAQESWNVWWKHCSPALKWLPDKKRYGTN